MSPEEFSRMSAAAENAPNISARDRRVFLRHLHSRAQHGSADRQGRLVLPEELCKKVGLKGEVALVGVSTAVPTPSMGRDPASASSKLRNDSSTCCFQVIARHLLPITAFPNPGGVVQRSVHYPEGITTTDWYLK